MTRRMILLLLLVTLAAVACGPSSRTSADPSQDLTADDLTARLPAIDPEGFAELLASSDRPLVVNVWASWCVPCRSEAPLLREAHAAFGDRIRFVGIDVQDSRPEAAAFLSEFGLTFENYFDPGRAIPAAYGGFGVPITYFFAPGGELVARHDGIIDERALAKGIDDLLRLPSADGG